MANGTSAESSSPELDPIWSGLRRLVGSSKAIVVLVTLLMACAGVYFGKITGQQALDFSQWIVLGYIGAVAVEDGAAKVRSVTVARQSTSPEAIKSLAGLLLPLINTIYGAKAPADTTAGGPDPSAQVSSGDTEPPPPPTTPGA